jgi:(p)ppGpp synthase/HD superfamily hydrolase
MRTFSENLSEAVNASNTLAFIKKAHAGQKYGPQPYWTHPKKVADIGKEVFGSKFNNDAYVVALLHDVIEDTEYGETELLELGYTQEILDAVKLLTKDGSMNYNANIQRIISSGNKTAMMVKFADNYVNYTGDKSGWDAARREKSQIKYKKSMQDLAAKLGVSSDKIPE